MKEESFQRYGAYYDLLYRDKDYAAESASIARILRAAGVAAGSLLEFGSGQGRHGRLLAGEGFTVLGVVRCRELFAAGAAARAAAGFTCLQGDIRTVRVPRTFDGILSLFHVISYLTADADVAQTFANAARHLRPGGVFFFDVWHGPAVLRERPSARVKRVEDERTRLTRIAEPELDEAACLVTVNYTIVAEPKAGGAKTTFGESHCLRYFFPDEIELFAQAAGFVVERSEEFLTGQPPSDATWGVAYLLRKPD